MTFRNGLPRPSLPPLSRTLRGFDWRTFGVFAAGTGLIYCWSLLFWTRIGGSVEGRISVIAGVAAGFAIAPRLFGASRAFLLGMTVLWSFALPLVCNFAAELIGLFSISSLESPSCQLALSVVMGVCVFTPGVAAVAAVKSGRRVDRAAGVTLGALIAFLLIQWLSLYPLVVMLAIAFAATAWYSPQRPTESAAAISAARRNTSISLPADIALALATGLAGGVALRFIGQWYQWTPATVAAVFSAIGLSACFRVRWSAASIVSAASGVLLVSYPLIVEMSFQSAARFDATTLLLATILAGVVFTLTPFAIGLRAAIGRGGSVACLVAAAAAIVGATANLNPVFALFAATLLGLVSSFLSARSRIRINVAAAGGVLAFAGIVFGTYQPETLPRLLHSSNAISMTRAGVERSEIIGADSSRLVAVRETPEGVQTEWALRGYQKVTCLDGMLVGAVSIEDTFGLRNASDVLAAVLPLTLHSEPKQTLVIGASNCETVLSAAEFGMSDFTVVDTPSTLSNLKQAALSSRGRTLAKSMRHVPVQPRWATEMPTVPSDIVLFSAGTTTSLASAGTSTSLFIQQLKRHVNSSGLLAIRYRSSGLPAESVLSLGKAMRDSFDRTHIFELSPGDWLAIGTDRQTPLIDYAFVQRLQRQDVRDTLARAGLDWSVVMSLYGLDNDGLANAIAASSVPSSSWLSAYASRKQAAQMMRRDAGKSKTYFDQISPFVCVSTDKLEDAAVLREIEGRLADIKKAREILGDSPDQFWAYRAAIKDRLKTRPRAAIQQVSYSDQPTLHQEDQRRKEYLASLAEAIAGRDAAGLSRFVSPHDPLVSYFLHGEAAHICEEAGSAELGLHHNLASVYGTSEDLSVTCVLDALEAICNGHGGSDVERYDLAQGLLEQLRRRWHVRLDSREADNLTGELLRRSIDQSRDALALLDEFATSDESLTEHWEIRQPILRRDLIERLRQHQRMLQEQSLAREQMKAAVKAQRAFASPSDSVEAQ